jgi:hypothetical protein
MGKERNKNQNLKCRNFHSALTEVQKDKEKSQVQNRGFFIAKIYKNIISQQI